MRVVFQSINGQQYRSEEAAREYYGDRFESQIKNNLLQEVTVDEDGLYMVSVFIFLKN